MKRIAAILFVLGLMSASFGSTSRLTAGQNWTGSLLAWQRDRDELSITAPKNNEQLPNRPMQIEGWSSSREVEIELLRDRKRVQFQRVRTDRDRWRAEFRLSPGRYEAVVRAETHDRLKIERRVGFVIGGLGKVYIESPRAAEKVRAGSVTIRGTSEANDVEVEIYRGRDRVSLQNVRVRDGRFEARANLGWGTYVVTVRSKEDGKTIGTDKRGFDVVDRNEGPGSRDLRLDRPRDRDRIRGGDVNFDGVAGGREVRLEIRRGRDRVSDARVDVRDGRFHFRVSLTSGHYDATITSLDRDRVLATRRISFDVDRK